MEYIKLEIQEAEPLDEETRRALDEAIPAYERGEFVTLEQSQINARERYIEWQNLQGKKAKAA